VGSDIAAQNAAEAQFEEVTTFDYWPDAAQQAFYYNAISRHVMLGPVGTPEEEQVKQAMFKEVLKTAGAKDDGGGNVQLNAYTYPSSNGLWLEITAVSNGLAYVIVHGTFPDSVYELLSKEDLTNAVWLSEGIVFGAADQDWTATTLPVGSRTNQLFIWARTWIDSDGGGLPDWWQLENFGHLGVDPYGNPDGDAWSNIEEYQKGTNPNAFNTPPAPSGFLAVLGVTGTNALLSWNPSPGPVTNYVIQRSNWDPTNGWVFHEIAEVSPNSTSFEDDGSFDSGEPFGGFGSPAYGLPFNSTYRIQANYAVGQSPPADAILQGGDNGLSVDAKLARNASGRWQLLCPFISQRVKTVRLIWFGWNYPSDIGYFMSSQDLSSTNFTGGTYTIPDAEILNHLSGDAPEEEGQFLWVQGLDASGKPGQAVAAGAIFQDAPCFVDGREHLKQNLLFQLRAATLSQPYQVWDRAWLPSVGYWPIPVPNDTNYVESGFLHSTFQFKNYDGDGEWFIQFNDLWPFSVNYQLHNSLYDPSNTVPSSFDWPTNFDTVPAPAVLGLGGPYWIAQDLNNLTDLAVTTNGSNITLQNNAYNLFGLLFQTSVVSGERYDFSTWPPTYVPPITLAAGASTAQTNVTMFGSQTTAPLLQTLGYYFAPVLTTGSGLITHSPTEFQQPFPLPVSPGFAITNQSPIITASVGVPILVGGWAKEQIVFGDANKFGYLGQYFERAFKISTNGVVTTNQTGVLSPYGEFFPTEPGAVALVTMTNWGENVRGTGIVQVISINVDGNHDGTMDFSFFGPDQTTPHRPFRFWINDDDDAGETKGDDVPGERKAADYQDAPGENVGRVDGVRDLVDFFPVYLNIQSLLLVLPADSSVTCRLKQEDSALNYVDPSWYWDLNLGPTNCLTYLTDTNVAREIARVGLPSAPTIHITDTGVFLDSAFVAKIRNEGKAMLLMEARAATTKPLVLEIRQGTQVVAETKLYLSISGVEQMFRHKNLIRETFTNSTSGPSDRLLDSSVPNEPENNGQNFVFLHGYNVSPERARGWSAEVFKRLYWSGSHAKFFGVTWLGDGSRIGSITPNFHTNVYNAFLTAPKLRDFLNTLTNETVIAAHSLGNMAALSAISDWTAQPNKFFMIDAAVALEAIDGSAVNVIDTNMVHSEWSSYADRLYASEWFRLFSGGDYRGTLTWSNRLANLSSTNVFNFYSSGEEVLRTHTASTPDFLTFSASQVINAVWNGNPLSTFVWALQEKEKGRMLFNILGSDHGGWRFSTNYDSFGVHMSPANAALLSDSQLRTNPFVEFRGFLDPSFDAALLGGSGSGYAQTNRNRILADAIPALTPAVGANAVPKLSPPQNSVERNFNMPDLFKNGWPLSRPSSGPEAGNWYHSDFREVAYTYVYRLFDEFVNQGNLK
jgi:hypothetical protein